MKKYYVKRGYFGHLGKVYVPFWKVVVFTTIIIYKDKTDRSASEGQVEL